MKKFYKCTVCGNMLGLIYNGKGPLECCNKNMKELVANTEEASTEKHLPEVNVSGDRVVVQIGSVPHPMEESHHIEFIYLETKSGGQLKYLNINEEPTATFTLHDGELVACYEYCNLHGLWKT